MNVSPPVVAASADNGVMRDWSSAAHNRRGYNVARVVTRMLRSLPVVPSLVDDYEVCAASHRRSVRVQTVLRHLRVYMQPLCSAECSVLVDVLHTPEHVLSLVSVQEVDFRRVDILNWSATGPHMHALCSHRLQYNRLLQTDTTCR